MNNDFRLILNKIKATQQNTLRQTCLVSLSNSQIEEINKTIPLLKQTLTIYHNHKDSLILNPVTLIPNLLIIQNEYLVLSNCTINKFKSNQAQCIQLTNGLGNLLIFFLSNEHYKQWIDKLKQFCKLSNFSKKFYVKEQTVADYYIIQHKKTNKLYIANMSSISNAQMELLNSEMQTLRSVKHTSLLDLKWVYQDCRFIYLIYEYFRCEKLTTLLKQGLILDQTQLASIILQLLQLCKFLNKQSIYHGNITLNNILINLQSSYLSIYPINMKPLIKNDKDSIEQYKQSIELPYLAPEILEGSSNPSIDTDLYQIGAVLYQLTFYIKSDKDDVKQDSIKMELINKMEEQFIEASKIQAKQINLQQEYKMVFSTSQLDLLKRLLEKRDQRVKLEEAMKHHWFVNIKQKFKPKQERRKQHLPSLNTIIELCEQSESTKSFLNNQLRVDDEQVLDENNLIQEFMSELKKNNYQKPPSRENHEKLKDFQIFKTSYEQEKSNPQDQFKVSKTVV
ncbi:unnamed protein product (macronuclear) [Paramecium tetraurelia]|uniref:Protein kinase domain-containing protein n=1 Tax=Paramecium tetraurelia TaxID=5888 RepID=A0CV09_PARTE|nr:uncharacterized protein GSPATT00010794001 [Paramecium tetraurelia]CAK74626.1 unnamed protein product [Paramecium tetraurelia]|eukprot:XP_001442023.1 hypothetical protein (macronuclear) [Paramecium tetraurelia strain d4-2]